MATTAAIPAPPPEVATVLDACPPAARMHLADLRELMLETAAGLPETGQIHETLKWGQPAFLTEQTKSGTTIRLGWDEAGARLSLFVHCQTSLVGEWRERYGEELTFIGTREISIPTDSPLPEAPLKHCVAMALTYHSRKTKT